MHPGHAILDTDYMICQMTHPDSSQLNMYFYTILDPTYLDLSGYQDDVT